jgi:hypothetical protein
MDAPPELTELQIAVLETEALGLPRRDAMRLVTQRVGYFVGQARYAQELAKARQILAGQPAPVTGTETAREDSGVDREVPGPSAQTRRPRSATHQIGSTGG